MLVPTHNELLGCFALRLVVEDVTLNDVPRELVDHEVLQWTVWNDLKKCRSCSCVVKPVLDLGLNLVLEDFDFELVGEFVEADEPRKVGIFGKFGVCVECLVVHPPQDFLERGGISVRQLDGLQRAFFDLGSEDASLEVWRVGTEDVFVDLITFRLFTNDQLDDGGLEQPGACEEVRDLNKEKRADRGCLELLSVSGAGMLCPK